MYPLPSLSAPSVTPQPQQLDRELSQGLETRFDAAFTTTLALREKQIQQSYRPVIGIHKWFARRPGTVFRSLLLAEFNGAEAVATSYWRAHELRGVIADPFMGGGTPLIEANRLGFDVVGTDINPMAYWIVRQSLTHLNVARFLSAARDVACDVNREVGRLYETRCVGCNQVVPVKYFLWVKTEACPQCDASVDLFPGYLLAEAERHPMHVLACAACGELNEFDRIPTSAAPLPCSRCGHKVQIEGPARSKHVWCQSCGFDFRYPRQDRVVPPTHRMWAIEYHCSWCKAQHAGRFFKKPDAEDLSRCELAGQMLRECPDLPIPADAIPDGDETARLHRWGYRRYRQMFNERQLLGLGLLLQRVLMESDVDIRHALLTVFSDFIRYQNMLCRYDTYALKCQDVFSVHGFPVGLVQCENSLLGIPRVGSGSFRHFVEKYARAKQYCAAPFETRVRGQRKEVVSIRGERIEAERTDAFPQGGTGRRAWLAAAPAVALTLPPASLDGVFTDPPYFDNVQYAELMDFCYVWLRLGLAQDLPQFKSSSTRSPEELTGNATMGRGLEHFTHGLSAVFRHYAAALKPAAPFVFTYHHNDPIAYVPLVIAILDAGMNCSATLPAAAEMGASLHISGTKSSVLDTVFVCRAREACESSSAVDEIGHCLAADAAAMRAAGVHLTAGDVRCLAAGHLARMAVNRLWSRWNGAAPLSERMTNAAAMLATLARELKVAEVVAETLARVGAGRSPQEGLVAQAV